MVSLDESYYKTRFPKYNNDFEELSNEEKVTFLNRYSLYMYYLYNYLITNTSIKSHDDFLSTNTNFIIPPIDDREKDMYQYLAKDFLKYYYIRNNLNLFCLSDEEIAFLDNRINNNSIYDNDAENFIEATFRKVICEPTDINTVTSYGVDTSPYYYALNGSLVIGQRYNEYFNGDLMDSNVQKQYIRRGAIIRRECIILADEMSDKLFLDVKVFNYVNQTVQKKENNEDVIMIK